MLHLASEKVGAEKRARADADVEGAASTVAHESWPAGGGAGGRGRPQLGVVKRKKDPISGRELPWDGLKNGQEPLLVQDGPNFHPLSSAPVPGSCNQGFHRGWSAFQMGAAVPQERPDFS